MWTVVALLVSFADPAVELRTLDGRSVVGVLETGDSQLVRVVTADGVQEIPTNEVWEIVPAVAATSAAPPTAVSVTLTDGTKLMAQDYAVQSGQATIKLANDASITVPTDGVAHVLFALQPEVQSQWQELLAKARPAGDLVVVRKLEALDYLEGVVGDSDDEGGFTFTLEGESLKVKRGRLTGIVYYHAAAAELPAAVAVLTDQGGCRYAASELQFREGKWHGRTPAGAAWSVSLDHMAKLDYSQGKVAYLSEMAPIAVDWVPFVSAPQLPATAKAFFQPKSDRGFQARELLLGGKAYAKGLALHSRQEVVYQLEGKYRRFQAVAGIDDRVRELGHVELVIRGDGKVLWEGNLTGRDDPEVLNLATDGVAKLSILVDYGDESDMADHLNLCEAKVIQ